MTRKSRYRRKRCKSCGKMVTTNALGRASHELGLECTAARTLKQERKKGLSTPIGRLVSPHIIRDNS